MGAATAATELSLRVPLEITSYGNLPIFSKWTVVEKKRRGSEKAVNYYQLTASNNHYGHLDY